jgi:hypothetical protein
MSTQRRENRWQRSDCTARAGASEMTFPAPIMRHGRARASGGTAPPQYPAWLHPSDEDLSPGTPEATNSLHLDYRSVLFAWFVQIFQLVQFVCPVRLLPQGIRRGSPPFRVVRLAATGTPTTHGLLLPHIPSPAGITRFHPTLPQDPTGKRRWAERYDGKRDLHLQHAA